jgi:hypothetical protein
MAALPLDLGGPVLGGAQRVTLVQVETEDDAVAAAVVDGGIRAEALLAGGVPHLTEVVRRRRRGACRVQRWLMPIVHEFAADRRRGRRAIGGGGGSR